jgi:TPR repeat protein
MLYLNGKVLAKDPGEGVKRLRSAAEHGDATAQYNLGYAYLRGRGVPLSYDEAVDWFRKSAAQGFSVAYHALGYVYENGKGVPQNYAEAARMYQRAAEEGFAVAQTALGYLYVEGKGVPQNATALSIVVCWLGVMLYTFDQDQSIYTYLLALSGFTGAIAWISICWSQYNFRKQLSPAEVQQLKYKAPLFPYITQFGIWTQIACLFFVAFTEELRISLYLGIPLLIVPIIIYRWTAIHKAAVSES